MEKTLQRILYVEDEPDIQRVVKLALEALGGFTVDVCSSGAEAVARAASLAPDLILLDVMMPQMDGVTTLQHLRKLPQLATTPVIFMTAKVQPDEINHFRHLGAVAVIAKPFDPMGLVQTVRTAWYSAAPAVAPTAPGETAAAEPPAPAHAAAPESNFAARLRTLTVRFHAELPQRLAEVQDQWQRLLQHCDADLLAEFHRTVHSLAGSGATFGLEQLSNKARTLDVQLKLLLKQQQLPDAAAWSTLAPFVAALVQELRAAMAGTAPTAEAPPAAVPAAVNATPGEAPLIYWVDDSGASPGELAGQLHSFGYRAEFCAGITTLQAALQRAHPAAVVFDSRFCTDTAPVFAQAGQLRDSGIPALMICTRGDFQARLQAVRAGMAGFLTPPVDTLALLARLDRLCRRESAAPYRVLLIDDEAAVAEYHATLLQQAGMIVERASDPAAALAAVEEFAPEVVVIDLYMPGVSGIELAKVMRQQERYEAVPIVFLSMESDVDKQLSALGIGADDFLRKPVVPEHFAAALTARAQRARALSAAMAHDSLTGLLNHRNIKAALDKEFARSRRTGAPFALALLDIDDFKQINERHGHSAGDRVLRALARLLEQRLRSGDYAGRYSGDEFLLVLPDTTAATARVVLDQLRAEFARLPQRSEQGEFTATFSGGVAAATWAPSAASQIGAADKALDDAKQGGRNRIEVAPD